VKISEESVDRNPNGVAYSHVKETSSSPERITFFLPDSTVDILPFMHEGDGYSGKVITQKIIDSFKYDGQAGEAAGTKTFSEIPGFTFKYPEFSGWEASLVNKVSDNNYEILLKDSNPNRAKVSEQYQPKIMVVKKDYAPGSSGIVDRPIGVPVMVNSNKVSYVYAKEELSGGDYTPSHYGYAIFYGKFMVWVQLDNLSEKAGFPADQFFKTVIDSFKFTDKITLEQAEILAKDFMLKQSGADILLRPEKTQERKFGYVFFFANKEYIETGNVSKLIPGIGPVAVEYSGKVVSISSSVDSAKAIDDYEQQWAQNN
jgi:hypothetical protein